MLKNRISPALLLAATVLAGCSSMPNQNILLAEARSDYATAQNNPDVAQLAPTELKDAGVALDQANAAFANRNDDEKVNKLAYLAKQKIATTQEIGKRKAAERVVANAGRERDQLRLAQRTAEVDKAKTELAIANADQKLGQFLLDEKTAEADKSKAELITANADKELDQLRLAQKTAETDKAKMQASIAQNQVADAQAQVADAQLIAAEAGERAQQLAFILDEMAAQETERGMVITLSDVLFNLDQAQLKPDGMRNVQKLSEFMKQYPLRTVLVEGFTDSTGSSAHNLDLSSRRAEAVRGALESMGVAHDRSTAHGYGEAYPVAANDTAANRQLNRRVEIILSGDNGRVAPR
jgi:outer membrane protein OmpA-like peptidoglycan-associated protein